MNFSPRPWLCVLQIIINSEKSKENEFTTAFEIMHESEVILKQCFRTKTSDTGEACQIAAAMAIGQIITDERLMRETENIHIICANMILFKQLPKIKASEKESKR